jgi:hypothetical protein
MRATRDERDIVSGARQLRTKVATDRPGPDYCKFHFTSRWAFQNCRLVFEFQSTICNQQFAIPDAPTRPF